MEIELPKRLIGAGNETELKKVNNSCNMAILDKLRSELPIEYDTVKEDPVFASIFAIHENKVGYSGRLVHSLLSRQLVTKKKHELWFVFGGRPLRFSMQEFHAVTGLKYTDDGSFDYEEWQPDNGYWTKLLRRKGKVCIEKLLAKNVEEVKRMKKVDRIRFVYLCVIVGVVMARLGSKNIDHFYIKMVMDIRKVRHYPWGLKAFDDLVDSIRQKNTKDLLKTSSYVLNGFSMALQIWAMEAIPLIGELVGEMINPEFDDGPRCVNWTALARVSFHEINNLESTFTPDAIVHPFMSYSGHDIIQSVDFIRAEEIEDVEVDNMLSMISHQKEFTNHVWRSLADENGEQNNDSAGEERDVSENDVEETEVEENDVDGEEETDAGLKRTRRNQSGVETRKKRLLCQRAAAAATSTSRGTVDEDTRAFLKGLFDSLLYDQQQHFKKIDERLGRVEEDLSALTEMVATSANTRNTRRSNSTQQTNPADQPSKVGVRKK